MCARQLALLAALVCTGAGAQLAGSDPDWKESEVPSPPAVRTQGLIPIELARSELRWGVDPGSIAVAPDGVVRYVVVAVSDSGSVNAFYEGLRCTQGEVKVYARHAAGSGWTPASDAQWRPLRGTSWRHSLEIAKAGACDGRAPNGTASRIVQALRSPPSWHEAR